MLQTALKPMSRIRVSGIRAVVAAHYGVTVAELVSPARPLRISRARSVAWWLAHRLTRLSLMQIARCFRKERQAVHYGVQRVERARAADPGLAEVLARLEQEIREAAS